MKVIRVLDKITKENIKIMMMSTFDNSGNPIEVSGDKIAWWKFKEWIGMKIDLNVMVEDSLENRIRLLNRLIENGKILFVGEPFEI